MAAQISEELLNDTYKHIAEQYEMKGNLKKAEHYYVEAQGWVLLAAFDMNGTIPVDSADATSNEAKMWTSAMSMYRQLEKWEDAKRVAKAPPIFFHESKSWVHVHGCFSFCARLTAASSLSKRWSWLKLTPLQLVLRWEGRGTE